MYPAPCGVIQEKRWSEACATLEQCLEHALEQCLEHLHCRPGRMRVRAARPVWNTLWNRQSPPQSAQTPICVLSHTLSLEHALSPRHGKRHDSPQGAIVAFIAIFQYEAYHVYARACEWEKQRAGIVSGEIK